MRRAGSAVAITLAALLAGAPAFAVVPRATAPAVQMPHNTHALPAPTRWQPPHPPKTWTAQAHHGYMDGVEAAWLDLADHLKDNPARHLSYQHPPNVKVNRRYLYRDGFRKGYEAVYKHSLT